jgi:hypothetical protein
MKQDEAIKAALARIGHRAAEFMVTHDDWSVDVCIHAAIAEEIFMYGIPGKPAPVGFLGRSPIQAH